MIQLSYKMGHEDPVSGLWVSIPNSSNGVSVKYSIKNLDARTIKYYDLTFVPYNNVNDPVRCSITQNIEATVQGTGPLSQNASKGGRIFENAWYNPSITRVELKQAKITYMDGSTEIIDGKDVKPISGGCYVATAVYGSYDCPEVWTLRRFRDYTLAKTWYGRAFIRLYYAISPTLVKWFGKTQWFKNMWKPKLDKMVSNLNAKGIEDTPYNDKPW